MGDDPQILAPPDSAAALQILPPSDTAADSQIVVAPVSAAPTLLAPPDTTAPAPVLTAKEKFQRALDADLIVYSEKGVEVLPNTVDQE